MRREGYFGAEGRNRTYFAQTATVLQTAGHPLSVFGKYWIGGKGSHLHV